MSGHPHAAGIQNWVSPGRFQPYLDAAGGDVSKACELYEWSTALSAASFAAFAYVEVVTRNAIDVQMTAHLHERQAGIPWLLLPFADKKTQDSIDREVAGVRQRLRRERPSRDTRDQIVAGLSFGFWRHMLGPTHDQLWRAALHRAFPHSSGKRHDVMATLEALRVFRK